MDSLVGTLCAGFGGEAQDGSTDLIPALVSRAGIEFFAEAFRRPHGHTFSWECSLSSRRHPRLSSFVVEGLGQKYTLAYETRRAHRVQLPLGSRSEIFDVDRRHTVFLSWFGRW
jgi:hypothetical protein